MKRSSASDTRPLPFLWRESVRTDDRQAARASNLLDVGSNSRFGDNATHDSGGNGVPATTNSLISLMSRIAKEKQSVTSLQRGRKYGGYGLSSLTIGEGSRSSLTERASYSLDLGGSSLSSNKDPNNGRKLLDRLLNRSNGLSSPLASSSSSFANFASKKNNNTAAISDQPEKGVTSGLLPATAAKPHLPCIQIDKPIGSGNFTTSSGTSASTDSSSHNIFEAIGHLPTIFKSVASAQPSCPLNASTQSQAQTAPDVTAGRVIDLIDSESSSSGSSGSSGSKEQEPSQTSDVDPVLDALGQDQEEEESASTSDNESTATRSRRSSDDNVSSRGSLSPIHALGPESHGAADAAPQLHDHNHRAFKIPTSLEKWKSDAETSSKAVKTAAGTRPSLPPAASTARIQDDISLFKSIQSRHIQPKPSTTIKCQLPEPGQLRKAARSSRKVLTKLQKKRLAESRLVEQAAKRLRRGKRALEDEQEIDDVDLDLPVRKPDSEEVPKVATKKKTSVAAVPAAKRPPPFEKDRIVIQYTVFRTQRLPASFDGNLMGKIIRGKAFADKNEANQHAASMIPRAGPSVTRIELDYGAQDEERDGMFFGRVHYRSGEVVFVYVERETQQFGNMDPAEYNERPINSEYRDLVLLPRYDVFVFKRKALDSQDGGYVVYEYDEDEPEQKEKPNSRQQVQRDGDIADVDSVGSTANSTQVVRPAIAEEPAASLPSTHFVPIYEGSFSTVTAANSQAVDAFSRWTRPQPPARLDALMYYRDVLQPYIVELRQQLVGRSNSADGSSEDSEFLGENCAEISWEPGPQLRYDYEEISVVVVRSQLEGPLDLTGAFRGPEGRAVERSASILVE
ncbi:hypothetical protein CMQ_7731 [Grosmannia clavigera kw1407]|uniref:Uncharacterized protein n=1 Tax=Grosmannia clavigera (strain kw1407 / UAMH 11150) TaxID=655863 RepID=F0XPL1_GROCL|nr:uncharacterized protein CMQ_7731 [Grosmannia clavigera kw1407]EFX00729.1 hypothetical protein CMQ_7731 [Grosmannia clavigera kw1407]